MAGLYKITWKGWNRKERRCVIAADNMHAALLFARKHYGEDGPTSDHYQIGPISLKQARRLRCDQLNANQLSLITP